VLISHLRTVITVVVVEEKFSKKRIANKRLMDGGTTDSHQEIIDGEGGDLGDRLVDVIVPHQDLSPRLLSTEIGQTVLKH